MDKMKTLDEVFAHVEKICAGGDIPDHVEDYNGQDDQTYQEGRFHGYAEALSWVTGQTVLDESWRIPLPAAPEVNVWPQRPESAPVPPHVDIRISTLYKDGYVEWTEPPAKPEDPGVPF